MHDRKGNWYFDLGRPTHSFCADFGLLSPTGRFLTLARSNYINMPRDGVSDVIDEEWMLLDEDYWKMYGFPAGSSPNVTELWRRMRMQGDFLAGHAQPREGQEIAGAPAPIGFTGDFMRHGQ